MADAVDRLNEARALAQAGKLEEAKSLLIRALQRTSGPGAAAMSRFLSQVLMQLNQSEQGLFYAQRASELAPGDADTLTYLASVLWHVGKVADAHAAASKAVAANPSHRSAQGTVVNFLLREDRFADALEACDAALAKFPGDPEFRSIRASMLLSLGRPGEAIADLREALSKDPRNLRILGALGPALNYAPGIEPSEIRSIHQRFGEALAASVPPRPPSTGSGPPDPERPLKIGFVSPDLRNHAMWHFIHPVLEHLDRSRFSITCYYVGGTIERGTETLQALGHEWKHVPTLHIGHLADLIKAEGIDILIDLAGHTRFNRLGTLQLRPAPVQMSMIGYPCTTGVSAVDYHITDPTCSPVGLGFDPAEGWTEKLLRVSPIYFCYRPMDNPPLVAPGPVESAGTITFGSFNTLMKLNDEVVRTWTRVVQAVPGSKLILKNNQLTQDQARKLTRDRFLKAGLAESQIEVLGHQGSMSDHLNTYARVDISLDTFPYAGMTTTCESLLMGVPVVTFAQRAMASRVGAAILNNVGLADLVASSEDEFVSIARDLAGDRARLALLRATLRGTLASSVVCSGRGFGKRFGEALREAWRGWCAKQRGN